MGTNVAATWSVTISGASKGELASQLKAALTALEGTGDGAVPTRIAKKTKAVEEDFTATDDETDEDDTDTEVDTSDVEEDEDETDSALDLKADIIPAFKKYAKDNGVKAAKQILKRFKVASVNELKEKDYPKVMNAIG